MLNYKDITLEQCDLIFKYFSEGIVCDGDMKATKVDFEKFEPIVQWISSTVQSIADVLYEAMKEIAPIIESIQQGFSESGKAITDNFIKRYRKNTRNHIKSSLYKKRKKGKRYVYYETKFLKKIKEDQKC